MTCLWSETSWRACARSRGVPEVVATSEAAGFPQMRLRAMTEADLAAVVEIERSVYPYPWTAGIFSDCLRVGYHCTILELDYVLVGYGIIASGAGEAHLLNVCVREEFRNRGFGRALLSSLLGQAATGRLDGDFPGSAAGQYGGDPAVREHGVSPIRASAGLLPVPRGP